MKTDSDMTRYHVNFKDAVIFFAFVAECIDIGVFFSLLFAVRMITVPWTIHLLHLLIFHDILVYPLDHNTMQRLSGDLLHLICLILWMSRLRQLNITIVDVTNNRQVCLPIPLALLFLMKTIWKCERIFHMFTISLLWSTKKNFFYGFALSHTRTFFVCSFFFLSFFVLFCPWNGTGSASDSTSSSLTNSGLREISMVPFCSHFCFIWIIRIRV